MLPAGLLVLAASLAYAQPAPPAHPYPRVDDTIGYKADPDWPREKPPGGEWTAAMSSVALGPDGNVWTFNRGKIPVQVYTQDGRLVKYWGEGGLFKNPHTVRFDGAGNVWIVDTSTQTVRKFTPDGKVLLTVGTPNEAGEDQTHMNQPNDVAIAPNGDLYVSDGYGNNRVVVFDKNGKFLRTWGKLGQAPGEFSQPHSIVLDSKGRVYVADRNNSRIQVFDAKGKFLTEWKNIITPWALADHEEGRDLCLWKFAHAVVGDSRRAIRAGHAAQGSAIHEARYRRPLEAALGGSERAINRAK